MSHKKSKASRVAKSAASKKDGSAIVLTLAPAARSAVVSAFASAMTTNDTSGNLLVRVCDTAYKYCKGKPIPEADQDAVANDLATMRKWSEESVGARKSEVRAVLSVYKVLPRAIEKLGKSGPATYFGSLALARLLRDGKELDAAIKQVREGSNKKANPFGRLASALLKALDATNKVAHKAKRKHVLAAGRLLKDAEVVTFTGKAKDAF